MTTIADDIDVQVADAFVALVQPHDLIAVAAAVLQQAQAASGRLTVVVTDDEAVQALNRDYRMVDAATDVLSFPAQDVTGDAPELVLPPELAAEMRQYLGDIVIAYPYAARQAAHFGNSVAAELRLLTAHGVLHLLGYDHATAEDEAEMWAVQAAVLAPFGDAAIAHRTYDDQVAPL